MRPLLGVPKSAPAAVEAFARTFQSAEPLPFDAEAAADPSLAGRERLKGAFLIDLERIRPDPGQPRREFDEVQMEQLAASVRERGVRQPIRVWYVPNDNVYQIVAGERRYRAAKVAGLKAIPCIVDEQTGRSPLDRKQRLVEGIVENWQRADLKPFELADALIELRDQHGLSQDEIATLTGKPKSEISRFVSLRKIDGSLQGELREDASGVFSRRHLVAVAKLPADQQRTLADKVRREQLSAAETERTATQMLKQTWKKRPQGRAGTTRRFAIGSALVEVRFRRSGASDTEVLDVLQKACRLLERQIQEDSSR
jgi:ParB family chromosome partitioning protein